MTALSSWRSIPMVVALLGIAVTFPQAQGRKGLDVGALLDQYAAGQFDAALGLVTEATREQARAFREQWGIRGQRWVNAAPTDRGHRLFIAAAFALEVEVARGERGDWSTVARADCAGRCTLEWARSLLLLRGDPDESERVWWLASIAFLEGVRDWRFLHTPVDSTKPFDVAFGHLTHGLERYPNDSHLQLAKAFAVGNRFLTVTADAPRGPLPGVLPEFAVVVTQRSGGPPIIGGTPVGSRALRQIVAQREAVEAALAALVDDARVGPEARVRLGYLYWTGGSDDAARKELRAAAGDARADADTRYLAHFLLGNVAQTGGDVDTARAEFAAALAARPDSQSASLGLAALQFQSGDVDSAYDLTRASLGKRGGSDDPWRQFLYAGFRTLPARLADLRREVRR